MSTWFDIERDLERLEELDTPILESFARVMPPPSQNPSFRSRFDHAQRRISQELSRRALSQDSGKDHGHDHWYKKPIGIIGLSVLAGCLLLIARAVLMQQFPRWFR